MLLSLTTVISEQMLSKHIYIMPKPYQLIKLGMLKPLCQVSHLREFSDYDNYEVSDAIDETLVRGLEHNDWKVERNFGLSFFKIDLALTSQKTGARVAVLVDTPQRYRTKDVAEAFTARADILEAFGWKVVLIPSSQIWDNYESVLERVNDYK